MRSLIRIGNRILEKQRITHVFFTTKDGDNILEFHDNRGKSWESVCASDGPFLIAKVNTVEKGYSIIQEILSDNYHVDVLCRNVDTTFSDKIAQLLSERLVRFDYLDQSGYFDDPKYQEVVSKFNQNKTESTQSSGECQVYVYD
jgi:hypothetical protein